MDTQIVAVFCLVDDMLKTLKHREDQQSQMNDVEVITTAIVAALFFGGLDHGSVLLLAPI